MSDVAGLLGCVSLVCGAAAQRTAPTARLGRVALGTVEVALPLRAADRENIPMVVLLVTAARTHSMPHWVG